MSLKDLIKVADYYNVKYSFGQVPKIDVKYQKLINNILEAYSLGNQIKTDGWWGGDTIKALNLIQEKFNLNPFSPTKESLDQLYKILRVSGLNPRNPYSQKTRELRVMIADFKKFLIASYIVQDNWDMPEEIVRFLENLKIYLDNIESLAKKISTFTNVPEVSDLTNKIVSTIQPSKKRTDERLKLAQQLMAAVQSNKDVKEFQPIINKMMELQKQKNPDVITNLLDYSDQLDKKMIKIFDPSGRYMPEDL